jgi:hypothetical protein
MIIGNYILIKVLTVFVLSQPADLGLLPDKQNEKLEA